MSACAWCLRYAGYRDEGCQFPGSEQCRTERELERVAHAINKRAGHQPKENAVSRTAHELITDAISGVYGDDPERSRVAADAIIEALGLVTLYHVKTPTIEHRGDLKYEGLIFLYGMFIGIAMGALGVWAWMWTIGMVR